MKVGLQRGVEVAAALTCRPERLA